MGNEPISDDGTKYWDGTAWVPIPSQAPAQSFTAGGGPPQPSYQFSPGAWGGRGNDLNADGTEVAGTSGAAQDEARYRSMGQKPMYDTGPQIDQSQSNESRGLSMGALGLLGARAGGALTPAQQLANEQTAGAVNGAYSGAASVKGGAMARAAAGRGAASQAGRLQAQGDQDTAALAAREQADAAGQYFGAASGQRGQDLGLATSQAGFNAGQRAANDQREGFYEGQSQNTQNSELSHQLGRTASDANAANQAQQNANAERKQDAAQTQSNISTVLGGLQGGAKAYGMASGPGDAKPPTDPNETGSDERTKTDVKPVSSRIKARTSDAIMGDYNRAFGLPDAPAPGMKQRGEDNLAAQRSATEAQLAEGSSVGRTAPAGKRPISDAEASRLRKQAEAMQANTEEQRRAAGLSTVNTPGNESAARGEAETAKARVRDRSRMDPENPYDDHGRSVYQRSNDKDTMVNTDALHRGIEQAIARDNPTGDIDRRDPYAPQSMFGARMGEPANLGYADSRKGKPGYMFGGAPTAAYGSLREDDGMAPGTSDALFGEGRRLTGRDRDIAMSDPRAKREAFKDGMNHANEAADTGKFGKVPDYMLPDATGPVHNDSVRHQPGSGGERVKLSGSYDRANPEPQRAANRESEEVLRRADEAKTLPLGIGMSAGAALAEHNEGDVQAQRRPPVQLPPAAPAGAPPVFGSSYMPQLRAMTMSDKDTKTAGKETPMANSNRSMAPHEYEYKEEFTPAEQAKGEKNVGPMANAMKADPVASTAIVTDPKSGLLAIDKTKGLKLVMGGLADLQRQVDEMHGRKRA